MTLKQKETILSAFNATLGGPPAQKIDRREALDYLRKVTMEPKSVKKVGGG